MKIAGILGKPVDQRVFRQETWWHRPTTLVP